MTGVTDVNTSLVFRLGVLGTIASRRFTEQIEPLGLKLKHVGMMIALDNGLAASQLELAKVMGVAPSLVVALADGLEQLGAVERVRDAADRRRQVLSLTTRGHELLATCAKLAHALDAELTGSMPAAEKAALARSLAQLLGNSGLNLLAD